ncbi:epidermal growth factor receptor kinase substrate 8-like protein 1 [Clupea harengus]|uniref:Epidermal growth factor receptor kinase substrate 8-like protein 1 n=1 Tax=Clupea harengus TaxID=7950 RepID=A0A6P8EL70_CLUHA|nr:epidermal growth factor receptor kinase substrate 8-like protein 1 [Clupea harengus]XP_031416778.1 epidermal growth factor receptor kinase substrate 8-like protein 1 [Clupea harengus]
MGEGTRYLINHLVTFCLQEGEVVSVEEARSRFSLLARSNRLWSQEMLLEIHPQALLLRDKENQELLEQYSLSSLHRCECVSSEKQYPSLLLLVCQASPHKQPEVQFFNCNTVKAERVRDDIIGAASQHAARIKKARPEDIRTDMDIPSPPYILAPNPPPPNPPPYPGIRTNGLVNGQPDKSFLRAQREVEILNHCFDDMEAFMGKLQQSAEAQSILDQRSKKKKKSRKKSTEDDLLTAKAKPPPEEEFIDIFQKFKYCFSLLGRLKAAIANPTSEELIHHIFKPLDMIVRTTGGPELAASVASPAMTTGAVILLEYNVTEEERQLWTALGPNWTQPRSQLRGPIPSYSPVFLGGWKAEGSDDPVETQHRQDAEQEQQQQQAVPTVVTPAPPGDETDSAFPSAERQYRVSYDFRARNSSELSVQQGDILEVVEASKRWWKCRNRFDEIGFVPFNILEPISHIESPINKAPKAPAPPPMLKNFSYAPPTPPLLHSDSNTPRPRSIALSHHIPSDTDSDKVMLVNDELLQRLTNGKSALSRPLVIPRSAETSRPLDYHSPHTEVEAWLRGKGFSDPTVQCLGVLTGAQLFSLNKEELRAVLPDEGARVYSQITVQKALLEDERRTTELEAVMEKQKMKVDLELESGTLTL